MTHNTHIKIALGVLSALLLAFDAFAIQAKRPQELPKEIQDGINQAIDNETAPLTPEEIRRVKENFDTTQRASRDRYPEAKPVITTEVINNKPGSEIPTIFAGVGYNTNIVFKDASGSPWPIKKDSVGNSDAYTLNKIDDHILQIVVEQPNAYSNLSFLLDGQSSLMVVNLEPPKTKIDVIKTYVVQSGLSPKAQEQINSTVRNQRSVSAKIDKNLNLFLDGTPPESAISIPVQSGPNIEIWRYKSKLVVKTRMRITSPNTDAEPLYGNNGWRVYSIDKPNSTMAFIDNGKPMLVSISESAISGMN